MSVLCVSRIWALSLACRVLVLDVATRSLDLGCRTRKGRVECIEGFKVRILGLGLKQ